MLQFPLYLLLAVCGQAVLHGGAPTPLADCNMACAGDATQMCGGPNRLNVYDYTGTDLPNPGGGGGGGGGGNTRSVPDAELPSPWTYGGCWM